MASGVQTSEDQIDYTFEYFALLEAPSPARSPPWWCCALALLSGNPRDTGFGPSLGSSPAEPWLSYPAGAHRTAHATNLTYHIRNRIICFRSDTWWPTTEVQYLCGVASMSPQHVLPQAPIPASQLTGSEHTRRTRRQSQQTFSALRPDRLELKATPVSAAPRCHVAIHSSPCPDSAVEGV